MNKKIFLLAVTAVSILLFSCTSIEQPETVFEQPDYTLEDVRNEEIRRIKEILNENAVEAYWRAYLLGDEKTKEECAEIVVQKYNDAISEKSWFSASVLYSVLENLSYKNLSALEKNSGELLKLAEENVPGLVSEDSEEESVAKYISGTVTILVDKGIKVENGRGFADRVIGSGFFISKDGYIVTNHHVIADVVDTKSESYAKLFIRLYDDNITRIPAKVVGWDSVMDLALLKAEVDAPYVFNLGSSRNLEIGDEIFCIGSPIGLDRTITRGIVSVADRMLFSAPVMQIDAAVNSGNSGGPCIDKFGNVQAVVFAGMLQYEGLNFAIPVEYLIAELPALFNGGKYAHSWIEAYGNTKKYLGKDSGVEINYVMPGGNAHRAGLRAGDVITAVDGQNVTSIEMLQFMMMGKIADSVLKISYFSGDDIENKSEKLIFASERPSNPGYKFYQNDILENSFLPIYGMKLRHASSTNRRKYTVDFVLRGSAAEETGFSENDSVEVRQVEFNDEKELIYADFQTKNRKKGYLDISIALTASLNSPYYF